MTTDVPPLFSVIVPTYDRPRRLQACLDALARLRYPRYEVIIVDDGSRRPPNRVTASAADRFERFTLLHQKNAGPAAARNRGARAARGAYLAFTDDDCRPAADWLRALASQFEETPRAMVGGRTVNTLSGNAFSAASQALVSFLYDEQSSSSSSSSSGGGGGGGGGGRFFASNNVALPRREFLALGGFDDTFPRAAGEDRELCDRWHAQGGRSAYAPRAVVRHAHPLTLRSFLGQQYNYGRGAYQFHIRKAASPPGQAASTGGLPEPPMFYLRLLLYSFRQRRPFAPSLLQSLLMLAAQGAIAAGFLVESRSSSTSASR